MDSKRQNAHFNNLIRKSLTAELMPAGSEGRMLRAVEAASAEGVQGQSSERAELGWQLRVERQGSLSGVL